MTQTAGGYQLSAVQLDRLAYRRGRAMRSAVVGLVSTMAVTALVVGGVVTSPGWPRVRSSFLDWGGRHGVRADVLLGMWLNVRVMVVCAVVILVLGMAMAVMRTLRGAVFFSLRAFATAYGDLFRGMPLLLLVGFGVPSLRLQGMPSSVVLYGGVALVLTYTSYVAEVFRAGIESVHPSQQLAARGLGLS